MKQIMSDSWRREYTNTFRERKVFSFLPFIVVRGVDSDFHWTGRWFQYVTIQEQKVRDRYLEFDDGWSFKHYWSGWETNWVLIRILDKK
jgi:hypothetical protein